MNRIELFRYENLYRAKIEVNRCLGDIYMSFIIGLLVLVAVGYFVFRHLNKTADAAFDVKPVVEEVKTEVKQVLDVNNDGKVDVADVVATVEKVKKGAKKAVGKAKTAVKKPKLKVAK